MPNLLFFGSDEYNYKNEGLTSLSLKSSAICTDETWSACPTCTKEDWDNFPVTYDRYAEVTTDNGDVLHFVKTNNCNITNGVGLTAYISLLFISLSVYFLQKATKNEEFKFDNAALTTTDFAVEVVNPPGDARDAEEWKAYFEQFGPVASITVTLDNEELLMALLNRRKLVVTLEDLQPGGVKVDTQNVAASVETALPLTRLQKMMFTSSAEIVAAQIKAIDEEIANDLSKRHYDVSNIFCIFEMEADQQAALEQLSVGGIQIFKNQNSTVPENLRFRGKHVLNVAEPPEPSSVRWQDLDESIVTQLCQRIATFSLTTLLIIASCLIVVHVRNHYGIGYAAIAITTANTILPSFCLYITDLESHASEGSKQASNYFKITASLWILTTMLTAFVTPFTDTLDSGTESLVPAIYGIFITELLKTPITMVLDIPGNVYRHLLAPRAPDQRRMNAYFSGTTYYLSERYTVRCKCNFYTIVVVVLSLTQYFS